MRQIKEMKDLELLQTGYGLDFDFPWEHDESNGSSWCTFKIVKESVEYRTTACISPGGDHWLFIQLAENVSVDFDCSNEQEMKVILKCLWLVSLPK